MNALPAKTKKVEYSKNTGIRERILGNSVIGAGHETFRISFSRKEKNRREKE